MTQWRPTSRATVGCMGVFVAAVIATLMWKLVVAAPGIDALRSAIVISGYPHLQARDFALNIWVPGRALLAGHDPYTPGSLYLKARYHPGTPPALYTPSLLLLSLPLILLPLRAAAFAMVGLTVVLIWLSIWLVVRPKTPRAWLALSNLGVILIASWPTWLALLLGQPAGLFALGVAVIAVGLRGADTRSGQRALACGVFLMCLKPQFGIPAVIVVLLLRQYRAALVGVAWTVAWSLPFSVLELFATGGFGGLFRAIRLNLKTLGSGDAGIARTDLAALVTHGAASAEPEALAFLAATAVLAGAFLLARRGDGKSSVLPPVTALVGYVLAGVYHAPYDLVVLYVLCPLTFVCTKRLVPRSLAVLLLMYYFIAELVASAHNPPHVLSSLFFASRMLGLVAAAVMVLGVIASIYDVEPSRRIRLLLAPANGRA